MADAPANLGALADKLWLKDQDIDKVQAKLKVLETERKDLHTQLMEQMDAVGTDIVRGKKGTASISETLRVSIADAEKFFPFVLRRKALHMFERRISVASYKELKEQLGGKEIPGLSEFTQRRLNVRKVS